MPMDADDGAVSCHHPHRCDSAEINLPGPSGGRMQADFRSREHQIVGYGQASTHSAPTHPFPGYGRLSDSDSSLQLMIPPSPPSARNHLEEIGDTNPNHGLPKERRGILLGSESSVREVIPRKRKHTHDSLHDMDHNHTQDNDAFPDGANSHPPRRIRPRLWIQRDREFSPLLYMSPDQERGPPVEGEIISAVHYPQNVTDPSHSIQRCFYLGNPQEQDTGTQLSSSFPKVTDPGDYKERKRSNSADSFAEVALASTVTPKYGRLSSLQDFWLPRPFEETEQPTVGITKVHERGLEAGPSFLSINGGRTGGPSASREPASGLPMDTVIPVREHDVHARSSPSLTTFFDMPICDSPDSIDPTDVDGLTHAEVPYSRLG